MKEFQRKPLIAAVVTAALLMSIGLSSHDISVLTHTNKANVDKNGNVYVENMYIPHTEPSEPDTPPVLPAPLVFPNPDNSEAVVIPTEPTLPPEPVRPDNGNPKDPIVDEAVKGNKTKASTGESSKESWTIVVENVDDILDHSWSDETCDGGEAREDGENYNDSDKDLDGANYGDSDETIDGAKYPRKDKTTGYAAKAELYRETGIYFGKQIWLKEGTVYYESADLGGSGCHATANNAYTETAFICGFAMADTESTRLTSWLCYEPEDVPMEQTAPGFVFESEGRLWVAFYTDITTGVVGWVDAEDTMTCDPSVMPFLSDVLRLEEYLNNQAHDSDPADRNNDAWDEALQEVMGNYHVSSGYANGEADGYKDPIYEEGSQGEIGGDPTMPYEDSIINATFSVRLRNYLEGNTPITA